MVNIVTDIDIDNNLNQNFHDKSWTGKPSRIQEP